MKMKKIGLVLIGALITTSIFAETPREKLYKEVSLGGKEGAKWFEFEDLSEYDTDGNLIYFENDRTKVWREYDQYGNQTLFKNSKGEVMRDYYQYDRKGNMIYRQHDAPDTPDDSFIEWYEYDNRGRKVYSKTQYPSGKVSERWSDYDNHGTKHTKSKDMETWEEYDSHGNLFHYRSRYGEWRKTFKYNAQGTLIYFKDDNYGQWYDVNGNEIHTRYASGSENWHEYDYDDNGHILYSYYKTQGLELWTYHEYTFHQNGKIKIDKKYKGVQRK